ncbi:HslU--HslV peptidase ATPase subunit [Sesbania bispinosa]|nr:HslU--HslV peptidase ATPase subunit [Sesbania bispinosa]
MRLHPFDPFSYRVRCFCFTTVTCKESGTTERRRRDVERRSGLLRDTEWRSGDYDMLSGGERQSGSRSKLR